MNISKVKIPSILMIFFLVVSITIGVSFIQTQQNFRLSASVDYSPKDIRISNITDKSFTVSWYTDKNANSYVDWGETVQTKNRAFPGTNLNRIHYIDVVGLKPGTNYYFKINSGGSNYDNSGIPWTVKTKSEFSLPKETVKGQVYLSDGKFANGVIIYMQSDLSDLYSAQTTENGSWVLPINNIDKGSILEFFVQGAALGTSSALFYYDDLKPDLAIYLGENIDLDTNNNNNFIKLPSAKILLPEENGSRFTEDN